MPPACPCPRAARWTAHASAEPPLGLKLREGRPLSPTPLDRALAAALVVADPHHCRVEDAPLPPLPRLPRVAPAPDPLLLSRRRPVLGVSPRHPLHRPPAVPPYPPRRGRVPRTDLRPLSPWAADPLCRSLGTGLLLRRPPSTTNLRLPTPPLAPALVEVVGVGVRPLCLPDAQAHLRFLLRLRRRLLMTSPRGCPRGICHSTLPLPRLRAAPAPCPRPPARDRQPRAGTPPHAQVRTPWKPAHTSHNTSLPIHLSSPS